MPSSTQEHYHAFKRWLGPCLGELACPTQVVGARHIPATGPALLVCNHRSWMDPYLISSRTRRMIHWVMAPFVASIPFLGKLMQEAGGLPILRNSDRRVDALIGDVVAELRRGSLVGIFPEGTDPFLTPRAPDKTSPFHRTFARAALAADIPGLKIVPACIYPIREAQLAPLPAAWLRALAPDEPIFQLESLELRVYQEALVLIGEPLTPDAGYQTLDVRGSIATSFRHEQRIRALVKQVKSRVDALLREAAEWSQLRAPRAPLRG
ncbi:MAG: lysophospholipid acyltransferase family protein [Candidatus Sericytochromatia bacterium]|nr:lysophospholipid acyltransferase family protein [Candidatus Sericytochromatia bacterium]